MTVPVVLAENVQRFARLLRDAGLPVGPGAVLVAVRALSRVNLANRAEFYWALHASFVTRKDQQDLFHEAFALFWRDPLALNQALALLLPHENVPAQPPRQAPRRLLDAWQPLREARKPTPRPETEQRELDFSLTYSPDEVFRTKDFEQMSAEELRRAKVAIARMQVLQAEVLTRRWMASEHGQRIDMRRTLRAGLESGFRDLPLCFKQRRRRPPPLVVLSDISGSMEGYARVLLHFMHTLTAERRRVSSFVFGTRLTDVTRALRSRDVDVALTKVGHGVGDWSGGTRIGAALREFNRLWARRVLAQGAIVLLITDGLDRGEPELVEEEMGRLHRSCRRLIWLNPLLRYAGFEPRARGVRAMLPHVDELRPVHNLESLEQLAQALTGPERSRGAGRVSRPRFQTQPEFA